MISDSDSSEKELIDALSHQIYLSRKRTENEKYEAKYDFGKCRICSDDATGIHYGTPTCEACKGFFRRSLKKNIYYKCRANKDCKIYPKKTKKCKYCRWNACINSGMSTSEIRVGRIPNSMKEIKPKNENFSLAINRMIKINKLDRFNISTIGDIVPKIYLSKNILNNSNGNQIVVLSLIRNKAFQLYKENNKEFEDLERKALRLIETGYERKKYTFTNEFAVLLEKNIVNHTKRNIYYEYNIVSNLPGFQRFSRKDLDKLISAYYFPIVALQAFKLFKNGEYFHFFDDDFHFNRNLIETILGDKLSEKVFEFFSKLNSFNLSDYEISLLIPFYITTFELNLDDENLLKELHEYYTRALYYEFNIQGRNHEFIQNFAQTLGWMPKLKHICHSLNITNLNLNI